MRPIYIFLAVIFAAAGCDEDGAGGGTDPDGGTDTNPVEPSENWDRDIVKTGLNVDMETMTGQATITMGPSGSNGASFDVDGLEIDSVASEDGQLLFEVVEGRLDVGLPLSEEESVLIIEYEFFSQAVFEGYMSGGSTLTWPYYCGNLFPCHSHPMDGTEFTLEITGVQDGEIAVYPEAIAFDAPSYQLAWAIGDYVHVPLDTSTGGTEIEMWVFAGNEQAAADGGEGLVEAFGWMEQTLGSYPFGEVAGGVQVEWGAGALGGMEHHPLWHLASGAMGDRDIHVHEAAHGWYGDGIRLACWEDLVLSEGTVTYLTARALGQAMGSEAGQSVWDGYQAELDYIVSSNDSIVWPDSCNELDVLDDGVFTRAVYIKGAYFYRAVAQAVGPDVLDAVFASFFDEHAGEAATMQEMLDLIQIETGFDPGPLADGWLRSLGNPDS